MKKSYDYFKTLKILSETVSVIYEKSLLKQDFSTERIRFFAEKTELINNLLNEFIAPIERGDIFLLEESLTEELYSVFLFQEYVSLINQKSFEDVSFFSAFFSEQNLIFSQLKNYKSNLKLFEQCSDEIKALNKEKKNIEKHIVNALKCRIEQPLIEYSIYSALLDLNTRIHKTILNVEKILINNS